MEEVAELDGVNTKQYFLFCAAVMKWVATGNLDDVPAEFLNTLPTDVRSRLELPAAG